VIYRPPLWHVETLSTISDFSSRVAGASPPQIACCGLFQYSTENIKMDTTVLFKKSAATASSQPSRSVTRRDCGGNTSEGGVLRLPPHPFHTHGPHVPMPWRMLSPRIIPPVSGSALRLLNDELRRFTFGQRRPYTLNASQSRCSIHAVGPSTLDGM
jgi:hypothetical protein